jgi:hypothetical protein
LDNLDEFEAQGHFAGFHRFEVYGDASGRASSSNSLRSNYDLIKDWFGQRNLNVEIKVPRSNPALVKRWTTVNAMCQNAKQETRIFVYPGCPVLNQGMKLSKKKKGTAMEDDSKSYQHITTALGYAVCYIKDYENAGTRVKQL